MTALPSGGYTTTIKTTKRSQSEAMTFWAMSKMVRRQQQPEAQRIKILMWEFNRAKTDWLRNNLKDLIELSKTLP